MVRQPVVAGQFYPAEKVDLSATVRSYMKPDVEKKAAIAVMSPHAGYLYSGGVAGKTISYAEIPEEVLILGPNHHGRGHEVAVYSEGAWDTPLGTVPILSDMAELVLAECSMSASDTVAHMFEHSLEVQVPFLQFAQPSLKILPICISHMPLEMLLELGEGVARAIGAMKKKPLIVASTDMTHYESGEAARMKDFMALEKVLSLDPEGLYQVVRDNRISMCGVMPSVVMLQAAKTLGAQKAELIAYSNSGDITGDQSEVVGYAGVRVF
jgi:AmmeMemoRadiSam system protein B